MSKSILLALFAIYISIQQSAANTTVELWPHGAPLAVGKADEDKPSLTIYQPAQPDAAHTAIVVCPGGGYHGLAMDHEGKQIADWLNSLGVTACVLKYRLGPRYHHPSPLDDAQRAVRTVRANAEKWNVNPQQVGILGFSAGGHLASTAATHFDAGKKDTDDAIDKQSSRPDFAVLIYPVIAMATEYGHAGSRTNLLGENPDPKLVESLSNEKQITAETPPCFLIHSGEDKAVPPENSILFYQGLRRAGVPAEMHIYERGPHGFGLGQKDAALATWPVLCAEWLRKHDFLSAASATK